MFNILDLNGLTVITSPMENFSTTGLGIFLKVGARVEKKKLKGIAHFIEHMLFKGTKKFSHKEIKREIEGRGGYLNGFTSQEVTGYYAQFLNKNLKLTLDILTDMVTNPLFDPLEIEKERNVILEEIKMYNDLPHPRSLSLLDKILWEGHPLGEDVIGSLATVRRIKKDDLEIFKKNFYSPYAMVICCVGEIKESVFKELLRRKIKFLKGKHPILTYSPPPLKKKKIVIETKSLDQTHLCVGFRSVPYRSRFRHVIELIHVIMGANMSSRFFEEIREKRGLCYDISTETKKYRDSGAFIIHSGLDKGNVTLALRCILKELKKIKNRPVSRDELERAKDYFLGQLSMNLERPQGRLFYLADSYIALGKIYTLKTLQDIIKKIDRKAIQYLAKKTFDFNRICISCVGNVDKDLNKQLEEVLKKEMD